MPEYPQRGVAVVQRQISDGTFHFEAGAQVRWQPLIRGAGRRRRCGDFADAAVRGGRGGFIGNARTALRTGNAQPWAHLSAGRAPVLTRVSRSH